MALKEKISSDKGGVIHVQSEGMPPLPVENLEGSAEMDNAAYKVPPGEIRSGQEFALEALGREKQNAASQDYPQAPGFTEELEKAKAALRSELDAKLQSALDEMRSIVRTSENGISAQMVGAQFNCPICGLRIIGPSLTAEVGKNKGFYEHPFDDSPRLSGKKCELKGMKMKSPVVFLEFVTPRPLTAKVE